MYRLTYSNEDHGHTGNKVIGTAKTIREAAHIARKYLGKYGWPRRERNCPGEALWVTGPHAVHADLTD